MLEGILGSSRVLIDGCQGVLTYILAHVTLSVTEFKDIELKMLQAIENANEKRLKIDIFFNLVRGHELKVYDGNTFSEYIFRCK